MKSFARMAAASVAVLGVVLAFGAVHAEAVSFAWNVGSGDWFTASNWSPSGPPGPGDDAVISNGGTCTLNGAASVTNFTLTSGILTGTGTLAVSGTTAWSGGAMTGGTGVTNANGPLDDQRQQRENPRANAEQQRFGDVERHRQYRVGLR